MKKAGRINTRSIVALAALMTMMSAFLASWVFMCPNDPLRAYGSNAARWTGYGIALAGFCLAVGGVVRLKKVENIDHLVTTGLFAGIRHPMYAGFTAWICGWVACYGSLISAAVAVICIGNILYWSRLEDRALELRYGEEYRRYRERTLF